MNPIPGYFKNVLFAFIVTAAFLLSLEILSRFLCNSCRSLEYSDTRSPTNIFEYDPLKVYKLKKNMRGAFEGKTVATNSFGYRDIEYAIRKDKSTRRILALGDSVTFGHGVESWETYPEKLEEIMTQRLAHSTEVINAAVPGYSAFQEYYDLERGLIFRPDIVTIQFVLNDVFEPYIVYKRYGGKGIDYHGVEDTYMLDHWLTNHSKFYSLMKELYGRIRFKTLNKGRVAEKAYQQEMVWGIYAAAAIPQDSKMKEAWREYLKWLKKIATLCQKNEIDCILIITPVDFQMFDLSNTFAQKTLKEFASDHGIECIDILPLIQNEARARIIEKYSLEKDLGYADLLAKYSNDIKTVWGKYFLGYDHLTPEGHRLVAEMLFSRVCDLLARKRIIAKKS